MANGAMRGSAGGMGQPAACMACSSAGDPIGAPVSMGETASRCASSRALGDVARRTSRPPRVAGDGLPSADTMSRNCSTGSSPNDVVPFVTVPRRCSRPIVRS